MIEDLRTTYIGKSAQLIGSLTRFTSAEIHYSPRIDADKIVPGENGMPTVMPAGTVIAEYNWANMPAATQCTAISAPLVAPHFCCNDGIELAGRLLERWKTLDMVKEAHITGLCVGATIATKATICTALVSAAGLGTTYGVLGVATGISAGAAKGTMVAVKAALYTGGMGAFRGAMQGLKSANSIYVGVAAGLLGGIASGAHQYYSLRKLKAMEDLLVECINAFASFAAQEATFADTRDEMAGIRRDILKLYKDKDPAEAAEGPLYRAFQEVQHVLREYALQHKLA